LGYSVPLVPFAIAGSLMALVDKIVINQFMTLADVGVYGIGVKIGMVIGLVISAFSMAYGPYAMSVKDDKESRFQYAKLFNIYLTTMLGIVLLIAFFDEKLVWMFTAGNPEFRDSELVVAPIALSLVVHSFFSQLGVGLNLKKKNQFFFYGAVFALVINVVLNLLLVPVYGIVAAAWTNVVAYSFICVWVYFINKRVFMIPYPLLEIGFKLICFTIAYAVICMYSSIIGLMVLFAFFVVAGFSIAPANKYFFRL